MIIHYMYVSGKSHLYVTNGKCETSLYSPVKSFINLELFGLNLRGF
ncbi:unnamed protein product, partial [Vitis vinifera]